MKKNIQCMKIDFNKPFLGLDNKAIEPVEMLHQVLGSHIARASMVEGATDQKASGWAVKVFNEGILDLDESDTAVLEKFIESIRGISLVARNQISQCIRDAKELVK